jgi:hypothetical protein
MRSESLWRSTSALERPDGHANVDLCAWDWYVHLVRFGRSEFAVATSERSLLTVLLAARGLRAGLAPNLRAAVGRSLLRWASLAS